MEASDRNNHQCITSCSSLLGWPGRGRAFLAFLIFLGNRKLRHTNACHMGYRIRGMPGEKIYGGRTLHMIVLVGFCVPLHPLPGVLGDLSCSQRTMFSIEVCCVRSLVQISLVKYNIPQKKFGELISPAEQCTPFRCFSYSSRNVHISNFFSPHLMRAQRSRLVH